MSLGEAATPVIFVYVENGERALAFYRDTLGLKLRSSEPHGDIVELGGALLHLMVMPDFKRHEHPVLGWNVADVPAVVAALRGKGIDFLVYEGFGQDSDGIWTSPDGSNKLAWFADPDGNVLMLAQG